MTPEAQRIAIAEAFGHKDIGLRLIAEGTGMDQWVWCSGVIDSGGYEIPDYLNDLNAMLEAEKTLGDWDSCPRDDAFGRYVGWLENITDSRYYKGKKDSAELRKLISASAADRAEAFLRTIGKWVEDKR